MGANTLGLDRDYTIIREKFMSDCDHIPGTSALVIYCNTDMIYIWFTSNKKNLEFGHSLLHKIESLCGAFRPILF